MAAVPIQFQGGGCMGKYRQHLFNQLHVYCRLREMGMPKDRAKRIARVVELFLLPIYRFRLWWKG